MKLRIFHFISLFFFSKKPRLFVFITGFLLVLTEKKGLQNIENQPKFREVSTVFAVSGSSL